MTNQGTTVTAGERSCPACGGRRYVPFADERIDPAKIGAYTYASRKEPEFMCLRLVRCPDCDLVYAPSPPPGAVLDAAYGNASYDSAPEAAAAALTYADALTPYVARLAGRRAALDIGAGSGPLLPWLKAQGFEPVVGVEPSHAAIGAAPPEIRPMLRQGMFSANLLGDVRASLVCSFMTLEHLADPAEFLAAAFDLLEPGGIVAVVVHNWRGGLNRILGLRSPIIDVEHLQLYSPNSARTQLARAGFAAIEETAIANRYPLRYWLRLTPLPGRVKRALAKALEVAGLSDAHAGLRVGNMLVVGVKPTRPSTQ
jgi:SAM-dependent methyltransferase